MKVSTQAMIQMMTNLAGELIDEGQSTEYIIRFLMDNVPIQFSDLDRHIIAVEALREAAQQ